MHRFWFHYNRPASKQRGRPTMSVHASGKCHAVDHIVCRVPVNTRHRKSQPHVVMCGKGEVKFIEDPNGHRLALIQEKA